MKDEKKTKAQLIQELALLRQQLAARAANDVHYQNLFEDMPLSLWEEDLSAVKVLIDAQRERGVTDFAAYFAAHPDFAQQCVERIRIVNVNQATLDMTGVADKTEFLTVWNQRTNPTICDILLQQVIFITQYPDPQGAQNTVIPFQIAGMRKYVIPTLFIASGHASAWDKVIIALIDITAQVAAQEALAERELQMRLIFDYAYDGISIHEEFPGLADRRLLECNERYAEMAGRSKQELLAISNTMLVQKEVEPGIDTRLNMPPVGASQAYQGIFSWLRPDNKENVIEYTAARISFNGRTLVIGLDRDITEQLQAQKALKMYSEQLETMVAERTAELHAQNRQLDAILRSTADGVVVSDAEGSILQTNRIAQGWLTQTLHPKDAQKLEDTIKTLARQVIAEKKRLTAVALELPGLDLELNAAPVESDEAHHRATAVVSIHDISHLKVMERMKTSFVANVSHELRTPITTIKLCAHLIEQHPKQLNKYLPLLINAAEQQTRLVQDIVILSRLDAGRIDLQSRPALLNELLQSSIAEYRSRAQQHGVTLYFEPLEPDILLYIDPNYIKQLFDRLVENAVAYTPAGGKISVEARQHPIEQRAGIVVKVVDTGIGISEAELPHIFERFFRGEKSATFQASGAGLGLAIVKAVAELHGGQVFVESVEGRGSTFTVWLPVFNPTSVYDQ